MGDTANSIGDLFDDLSQANSQNGAKVGEVLDRIEDRSLGFLLAVLGLIAALPVIGALPGVSVVVAVLIAMTVGQSFLGRSGLWLPGFLRKQKIDNATFDKALKKSRPVANWIDRHLHKRLTFLVEGQSRRTMAALAAALLGVAMVPLAIIPWGVQAPAVGVLAIGLGLMRRDGLATLLGYAMAGVTVGLAIWFL